MQLCCKCCTFMWNYWARYKFDSIFTSLISFLKEHFSLNTIFMMLWTQGFQFGITIMNISIMSHFSTCFGALAEFLRIFWEFQGFTLKNKNAFVYNSCLVRVGFPLSRWSCSTVFRAMYFFSRVSPTSIPTSFSQTRMNLNIM